MTQGLKNTAINRIAFVGNYLPRQCGIATFTTDLCEAIAAEHSDTTCIAVPVNDIEGGYAYPSRVRFELTEKDLESYRRGADFLNINSVDLVCLQFEYGIFGGRAGSHILTLLRDLRMPIVTTLHTILREPDAQQRRVLTRSRRPVGPFGRDEQAQRGVLTRDLSGCAGEDRSHSPWHSRSAVRRSEFSQRSVRR